MGLIISTETLLDLLIDCSGRKVAATRIAF